VEEREGIFNFAELWREAGINRQVAARGRSSAWRPIAVSRRRRSASDGLCESCRVQRAVRSAWQQHATASAVRQRASHRRPSVTSVALGTTRPLLPPTPQIISIGSLPIVRHRCFAAVPRGKSTRALGAAGAHGAAAGELGEFILCLLAGRGGARGRTGAFDPFWRRVRRR
jgi:hypothetical protein